VVPILWRINGPQRGSSAGTALAVAPRYGCEYGTSRELCWVVVYANLLPRGDVAFVRTAVSDLLGLEIPVIQAPIGNVSCVDLAVAVSEAGGLGMLAASWRTPRQLRTMIREIRERTARPFGVNLVLQWPEAMHELLTVCLEEGVPVISFFWGDPTAFVERIDDDSVHTMLTVGSAADARAAVAKGIDIVVAQGFEAGGHVWGTVSTMALIPSVVDAVDGSVPVVAAGGIGDARGIAAALALGAAGIWMGSRFVATREAAAHPKYKEALLSASEADTVYTRLFDEGWPNAPHRVLRNSTVELAESASGDDATTGRPGQWEILGRAEDGSPIKRYADAEPLAGTTGDVEAMSLYAGQSCGVIRDIPPAGALVAGLWEEARGALERTANIFA
jgi:nitronate monooxygenase